jgi:hypothetical protein
MSSKKVSIVLANLTPQQLTKILELCKTEKIKTTFDRDYYSNFDIDSMLYAIIKENKPIPECYKNLINKYKEELEDAEQETDIDFENIQYC